MVYALAVSFRNSFRDTLFFPLGIVVCAAMLRGLSISWMLFSASRPHYLDRDRQFASLMSSFFMFPLSCFSRFGYLSFIAQFSPFVSVLLLSSFLFGISFSQRSYLVFPGFVCVMTTAEYLACHLMRDDKSISPSLDQNCFYG